MRPDRIVIGELRNREMMAFASSVSAGHRGVASTVHAVSVADVRARFKLILNGAGIAALDAESILRDFGELSCVFLDRGAPPRVLEISAFSC